MNFWQQSKQKRYEEINLKSRSTAALASLIEVIASSFGNQSQPFDPEKYLPIHFEDRNSPLAVMRRDLGEETIAVAKELLKEELIPPKITRDLFSIEELRTILLEEDE